MKPSGLVNKAPVSLLVLVIVFLTVVAAIFVYASILTISDMLSDEPKNQIQIQKDQPEPAQVSQGPVFGSKEWDEAWELRMETYKRENERRYQEKLKADVELSKKQPKMRKRAIRQFKWGSPAEARAVLWNLPHESTVDTTATAFLRVCISEASGNQADCLGIWQVLRNIRSSSCDRDRIRNITECDERGETYLSAMRRASRSILGMTQPKTKRQLWVSRLELDCKVPKFWPHSEKRWNVHYKNQCLGAAKLASGLASGRRNYNWPMKRAVPIAWGGRCESGNGACDDDIACSRGLSRLYTKTLNAFWCRPGTQGCSDDIDPICIKRGFRSIKKVAESSASLGNVSG